MNFLSVFKMSHRWSQMINRLLMICLWSSMISLFIVAFVVLMGGWHWESVRIAFMVSGIAVILLFFTIFMQKSIDHKSPKTLHDYYEAALFIEETKGMEASQKMYETICEHFEMNLGPAYLSLAAIYLNKKEVDKAKHYIQKAAKEDWVWYRSGLELLIDYYRQNDLPELEKLLQQMDRVKELEERASQEIYYFSERDSFQPNDRTLEVFYPIIQILLGYINFDELFIIKKQLKTIPDRQVYAIAVVVDKKDQAQQWEEKIYQECYKLLAQPLGKYIFFEYTISFLFLSKETKQEKWFIQKLNQMDSSKANRRELEILFSNNKK